MVWPSRSRRGGREGHVHAVCHGVSWLYHLFSHCQAFNPAANWRLPTDSINNATVALWCFCTNLSGAKCKWMWRFFFLMMATSQVSSTLNMEDLASPPWQRQVWTTQKPSEIRACGLTHQLLQENNWNFKMFDCIFYEMNLKSWVRKVPPSVCCCILYMR